ncbi:Rix1 complex component [Lipomyces tetrasporus]|uniref:Pre-rRNA-processing protein n=1 Tax=Lipomyces tetrasporus TaxID=54092 RepID=A0AAD7QUH7_9ASCO|nr:Rix1 complex component [Lipomyces tetrasporus]KAJ8101211.1 Rix1 complex component [Lipomyces tetrasporus]
MGSQRRKKEKKKDFVKPKLKVGKTKPKPTSHTELGFKAKAIGLPEQSITKAHTPRETFNHYLSLARHHSHTARREALTYLQSHLPEDVDSSLFTSISPLILDPTSTVRAAVLSLVRAIPTTSLAPHVHLISLYIHAGMTHLAPDVRADSSKVLLLLLKAEESDIPMQLVTRSWAKFLHCFGSLLGWDLATSPTSSSSTAPSAHTDGIKWNKVGNATSIDGIANAAGHLEALSLFLRLGLSDNLTRETQAQRQVPVYHADTGKHLIPRNTTAPYARLGLFVEDKSGLLSTVWSTEDTSARYQLLKPMLSGILSGLDSGRRQGGEIGRTCKYLIDFLDKVKLETEKLQ